MRLRAKMQEAGLQVTLVELMKVFTKAKMMDVFELTMVRSN